MHKMHTLILVISLVLVSCDQNREFAPVLSDTPQPSISPSTPIAAPSSTLKMPSRTPQSDWRSSIGADQTLSANSFGTPKISVKSTLKAASQATMSASLSATPPFDELTPDSAKLPLHDLIVFLSEDPDPFREIHLHRSRGEGRQNLYAFSPDGKRAGRLSPAEFPSALHFLSDPSAKPLIIEYGVQFNRESIQGVPLPPECYQGQGEDKFLPCDQFRFSPNGQYLGFFYGPDECFRAIIILDTKTGTPLYISEKPNGHYYFPLDNGKALIAEGHCEGGSVSLFDLRTKQRTSLGGEGRFVWNVDHSALVGVASPYFGTGDSVWGYNVKTGQKFIDIPLEKQQIVTNPVWAPDNLHLLFEHSTFAREGDNTIKLDQPREIIIVDAQSGDQRTLLGDPTYDYHLGTCPGSPFDWYGDWIQVCRFPFYEWIFEEDYGASSADHYQCRIYGSLCNAPIERFAFNWKTGELMPWEQTIWSKQGRPQKLELRPDVNKPPIYAHPSGQYAYYIGIDGRSLWRVSSDETPVMVVEFGKDYFYIP